MKALILAIVILTVAVLAIIPAGLDWGGDVLAFLRGALPVVAILIGLVLFAVGISDIKERKDKKKENNLSSNDAN